MAMYGDEDYYPGDKSTDDLHSYGASPDDRAIDKLAARARIISPEAFAAPVGRVGNFAAGAGRSQKEAWDQRQGTAANLAADKMIHDQATEVKPKTQAQRRAGLKGNTFRPEDRQGTEYAERAARAKARDKKD